MDPDDILRFFFPDAFREPPKDVKKSNVLKLAAFVLPPLLAILGYWFFYDSRMREPDPFSLEKTPKFSVKRQHSTEDITFYVDEDFDRQTRGRLMYLQEVEAWFLKQPKRWLRRFLRTLSKEGSFRNYMPNVGLNA